MEKLTLAELQEAQDKPVYASDGEVIGDLESLYYDEDTGEPEWISVRTGGFLNRKRVLVPAAGAALQGDGIRVRHAKGQVESAPGADEETMDQRTERALADHYGGTGGISSDSVVRHKEELVVERSIGVAGSVHAHKRVETERYSDNVSRTIEEADVERVPAGEGDSGQVETLADGSVSIPLLEEEIVVTKRMVVRERVIIRKRVVTEQQTVEADLRKEHIEIDSDSGLEVVDETRAPGAR